MTFMILLKNLKLRYYHTINKGYDIFVIRIKMAGVFVLPAILIDFILHYCAFLASYR